MREADLVDFPAAVVAFARSNGVEVESPVSLRSTNNTVAWLAPSNVVAKVGLDPRRARIELAAARTLAFQGAPVIAPSEVLGDLVHDVDGHAVTFWRYVPPASVAPSSSSVATALALLHQHMRDLDDKGVETVTPYCDEPIRETMKRLGSDRAFARPLPAQDRRLLIAALGTAVAAVADAAKSQLIHGSPHRFNIIANENETLFIDFETVTIGPIEWDLAHLEREVSEHYPGDLDEGQLAILRIGISAMTSAHCFDSAGRGPDMIDHAQHHLAVVQRHYRDTGSI